MAVKVKNIMTLLPNHKKIIIMEREKHLPQQYISTPFAYTKFSKNLSLLQQSVLTKVSEHLQSYVRHFFGSALRKDPKVPRPLFSDAEQPNGIPEFMA